MRAPRTTQTALFTVAMLLVVAGAVLLVLPRPSGTAATSNQALTDTADTRQVTASVSADIAGIYSYDYTNLAATRRFATRVLAGQAAAQYAQLSRELSAAVTEKLTVVTKVTAAGVSSLTQDSATLLVFLRQTSTRDGKPAGTVPAQLQVTATLTGGRWLMTGITAK
jgi:Mce-associated membrane protein